MKETDDNRFEETLFQQLVNNDEVDKMLHNLRNTNEIIPDDANPGDVAGLELAMSFEFTDIPRMIEELEELNDGEP